jgi:hypothetical protein
MQECNEKLALQVSAVDEAPKPAIYRQLMDLDNGTLDDGNDGMTIAGGVFDISFGHKYCALAGSAMLE